MSCSSAKPWLTSGFEFRDRRFFEGRGGAISEASLGWNRPKVGIDWQKLWFPLWTYASSFHEYFQVVVVLCLKHIWIKLLRTNMCIYVHICTWMNGWMDG